MSFQFDNTKDNIIKALCSSCKNMTRHQTLTSINESGSEEWTEYHSYFWDIDYEIIQCLGCERISFRTYCINSEHEDHEGNPIPTTSLYPKRSFDTLTARSYMHIPFNLGKIYKETINSYNSGIFILCAAGVRAIVEGLCLENGISGGNVKEDQLNGPPITRMKKNLQGKINGLFENGILTSQNAESLHEHRFLGNEAVHQLSSPSKEDLSLAIEIIENVFDTIYEMPKKALRLKQKRLKK